MNQVDDRIARHSASQSLALAALVFVTLAALYSLTYDGIFHSGDEYLFVAGAQSLGAWGELSAGQVYSIRGLVPDVEPGLMVLGAGLYQLARLPGVGGVQVLFLTNIFATALTGSVVFWLARQWGCRPVTAAGAALIFGAATLAWPHSKYYFRDPLAMLFVALAALSFELTFWRRSLWTLAAQWIVTFAFVAAGTLAKTTAVMAAPVMLVVALMRAATNPSERRAAVVGWGLIAGVALSVPIGGALARLSPLGYWNSLLSLLREPLNVQFGPALVGTLVSPGKGLFIESPVLLLAAIAPWLPKIARDRRQYWAPWLMTLGLALAVARLKDNLWWGGVGWGVRHMLPAVPLLCAACAPLLQAIWDGRARWLKLGLGALILASGIIQLGAVTALPSDYYDRIGGLRPGAAWTIAIWNPRYSEIIGYWEAVAAGHAWDFAWVRSFPDHPARVVALMAGLIGALAIAIFALWRAARGPWPALKWAAAGLTLAAVSVMPYGLLRAYYSDPFYFPWRNDFRQAADYLARNARPGDAVVVRGSLEPVWYFFLNYAHSPAPWYGIDAAAPDDRQLDAIRAGQTPELAFSQSTRALFERTLPTKYGRLWLVNDYGAPGGGLRLEEWWLAQHEASAHTEIVSGPGRVAVSLFAVVAPAANPPQPVDVQIGDAIHLTGYAITPPAGRAGYHPGDTVPVSLYWKATQTPAADYVVGVYLLDAGGALRAQQDLAPVSGFYPTSAWRAGDAVADHHALQLPDNLAAGPYQVVVAVYDWRSGERLPVNGPAGSPPDRLAFLSMLQIGPRR